MCQTTCPKKTSQEAAFPLITFHMHEKIENKPHPLSGHLSPISLPMCTSDILLHILYHFPPSRLHSLNHHHTTWSSSGAVLDDSKV